ncbi:MAG: creatininase family protein [Halobacteriaceae archaeon]
MSDDGDPTEEYRYEKLTWEEVDERAGEETLVVVPVGSTEDHGPHLPLDVDQRIPTAVCERTARDREDTLLFPTVSQGYLPHHMDYPGGVTIGWETFVNHLIDVGVSLAHHGFRKVLFVNGHGSNHHLVEQASRQIVIQYPEVQAAMLSWWELEEVREEFRRIRDAGPKGTAHAGELETSVYLHLDPDRVKTEEAPRDVSYPESRYFNNVDLAGEKPANASTSVTMTEWWSTTSETGVKGDASVATAEKGERVLAAAVAGLHELLDGFAAYPIREVEDHHSGGRPDRAYDPFRPR